MDFKPQVVTDIYGDISDEGTPVDEPVWQLRGGVTRGGDGSGGGDGSSPPGQKKALGEDLGNEEQEEEEEDEEGSSGVGRLRFEPPGMVSSRYLSATATPDPHVHIFRETTV